MRAIRVSRTGGPEVLEGCELSDPQPSAGELLLEVTAVGVNYIDVYRRTGLYPVPLPSVPGTELSGTVLAVGPGVKDFSPGDRVATLDARGAYAERSIVRADRAVHVPQAVSPDVAAAVMMQGLTAHYLVTDTFPLRAGQRCLIHAAAGGVGLLLVQLARRIGAEVFATVGSEAKVQAARGAGAHHVIVTADEDFTTAVEAIAGKRPLDVVYDGVGRATFAGGLAVLRPRGMMVTFGNASGPVDPVNLFDLTAAGSLFLTRPSVSHYIATTPELRERAEAVLGLVADGALDVRIGTRLPLDQAAEAHRRLESRETSGKVILIPNGA
ncbi:MAG: quinone oxidoreductase [Actinomycetota bacterium]|nr:quinone oxidoreductase [Actinomycetota bacterium]